MSVHAQQIEELYRARYASFHGVLSTITGSSESAHDAVQEAFARALKERQKFRGDGTLEGWVWRIALRAAHELRERQPRADNSPNASTVAAVLHWERDPRLAEALTRLAPRRRLIVFLHYFADLSYAEIAQTCGVKPGTVAATLAQARSELLEALDPEGART